LKRLPCFFAISKDLLWRALEKDGNAPQIHWSELHAKQGDGGASEASDKPPRLFLFGSNRLSAFVSASEYVIADPSNELNHWYRFSDEQHITFHFLMFTYQ
jgi:hypothetical protein